MLLRQRVPQHKGKEELQNALRKQKKKRKVKAKRPQTANGPRSEVSITWKTKSSDKMFAE